MKHFDKMNENSRLLRRPDKKNRQIYIFFKKFGSFQHINGRPWHSESEYKEKKVNCFLRCYCTVRIVVWRSDSRKRMIYGLPKSLLIKDQRLNALHHFLEWKCGNR